MGIVKSLFTVFSFLFLYSCESAKKSSNSGIIHARQRFYDKKNTEIVPKYMEDDKVILFKDSFVIYQVPFLHIEKDINKHEKWEHKFLRYTYLDLKTMVFYDYSTLTDTATLLRKYKISDTETVVWAFYKYREIIPLSNNLFTLPDTIISGKKLKRMGGVYQNTQDSLDGNYTTFTYFMDCSKSGTIFHIVKAFDEKFPDCPAVRFDMDYTRNKVTLSTAYEFVSDKLTEQESKIFKQWGVNSLTNTLEMEFGINTNLPTD